MKKLLAAALFVIAANRAASVDVLVIEWSLIIPEHILVRYQGLNQAYSQMFQYDGNLHAYFAGKAAAYAEMLDMLKDSPPLEVAPNPK